MEILVKSVQLASEYVANFECESLFGNSSSLLKNNAILNMFIFFELQVFSHSLQDSVCPKVEKQEIRPSNLSQFISRNIQMIGPNWPDGFFSLVILTKVII